MINVTIINASHTDRTFGNILLTYRHKISLCFQNNLRASLNQRRRFKIQADRLVLFRLTAATQNMKTIGRSHISRKIYDTVSSTAR